ncbi:hypothetical protein JCM17960_26110 [Magnetospira thiophila]
MITTGHIITQAARQNPLFNQARVLNGGWGRPTRRRSRITSGHIVTPAARQNPLYHQERPKPARKILSWLRACLA